jgi:signal transduction histidine kinase
MSGLKRSMAQCVIASATLAVLTGISYRLHLNIATVSLLFVIVVAVLARVGTLVSSIVASIVAVVFLAHLAPPAFSFRIGDPLDAVAIAAFFVTSIMIASLVSRVRTQGEEALSSVSHRVVEAEEQERRRIAKDLHEGIGQRVTLLVIEIERLQTDFLSGADVQSRIDSVLQQNLEILTDVKILAHELYSPRLEYLGIAAVMSSFCRELGQQKKIEINFRTDGLPGHVPPDVSLCLFRVLQEALRNAVQHSGARQLDVQLNGTAGEIHLKVHDSGVGFDAKAAKKSRGLGLNHMQERLKLVKGSVSIDSQPKRGTTIHARVPLRRGSDSFSSSVVRAA